MTAQNTDKFRKVASNTGWQVGSGGVSDAVVTTIPLVSASGIPTDTGVTITIDRIESSGTKTPSKMERITGVVSGTNIINCVRGVEGTAQAHAAGAVVEVVISAANQNDIIAGILAEHGQDGKHGAAFHALTEKTTPVDADEMTIIDSAASWVLKKITLAAMKLAIFAGFKPSDGFTWNIKIVPSVASNNLTVAIKGKDGNDLSASNPGYVMIGGEWRAITAALSNVCAAGTNWFNAGSAELAAKEIDYFAYLLWDSTSSSVQLITARIPFANVVNDFTNDGTNEKGYRPSAGFTRVVTDVCENIGRFAATLSAGAGYTWTVPTFTAKNLIQRPIFETRWLTWLPTYVGWSNASNVLYYKISSDKLILASMAIGGTSNSATATLTSPFSVVETFLIPVGIVDNNVFQASPGRFYMSNSNIIQLGKIMSADNGFTSSGAKSIYTSPLTLRI